MHSHLKELKKHLSDKNYTEAINTYARLIDERYPRSILKYYSSRYPFLLIDKKDTTRAYTPINIREQSQGLTTKTPLVSIIIVAYNSKDDLEDCLNAVIKQSYTNWELILIDNGCDGSAEFTNKKISSAKVISCNNVGFAEANNVGLENSNGELLLLLNPDAKLSKECIKELVFAGRKDPNAAAIIPKIYFYKPFVKLKINSQFVKYTIDYKHLLDQLEYQKIFILHGSLENNQLHPNKDGEILLDIAINPMSKILSLSVGQQNPEEASEALLEIEFIGSSAVKQFLPLSTCLTNSIIHINLDKTVHSSARHLINNAGSDFREDGTPYDIGFGQEDGGQYNITRYVKAFCGCCVLLRRDLFINRKIFVSEFFAYFEDTELSNWIQKNNLKILYVNIPVYHKHSTATQEGSPTWNALVSRSKNLYKRIKDYSENKKTDREDYFKSINDYESISTMLKSKLIELDESINTNTIEDLIFDKKTSVGIYNIYWSSMGGGEKHALDFAERLSRDGRFKVYLISEKDFSVSDLAEYFDLDLEGCKKLVTGEVTTALTKRFDIFINSTYQSNLISESPNSLYIVSFPQKSINQDLISSYTFLHNSSFTAQWAQKYWGEHQSKIILPTQQFSAYNEKMVFSKQKYCLSVGRFNYRGHCKNHHLIIKAFNQAVRELNRGDEWKLVIAGSVDDSSQSSVEHFEDCQLLACDNVEVIANVDRKSLTKLYQKASIYIHGTGMNLDINKEPQLCEHFGITVFESLINGCYPIVHNSAGPKEQIKGLDYSALYKNEEQLTKELADVMKRMEENSYDSFATQKEIIQHSKTILESNDKAINNIFKLSNY